MNKNYIFGYLSKNSNGRYCINDDFYFTSGSPIELLHNGDWIQGRIEFSFNHDDYYFLNEDLKIYVYDINNLAVRVKKS